MIDENLSLATFGGGCFWCTEALYQRINGVVSVVPGYSGCSVQNPSYESVCRGDTGCVESVQIKFDPNIVSYEDLLEIFWGTHDPTTPNQQGNDVGTQYHSTIFTHNDSQQKIAKEMKAKLNESNKFGSPVVTTIKSFENFYEAEDYHKNYYERNKEQAYCNVVITPKINKLTEHYSEMLKSKIH